MRMLLQRRYRFLKHVVIETTWGTMLVLLLCGPMCLLQVVAWTGMVFNELPRQTLSQAVVLALDGEDPCSLCTSLQEHQQTPQPAPRAQEKQGITFICDLPDSGDPWWHSSVESKQLYWATPPKREGYIIPPSVPPPQV